MDPHSYRLSFTLTSTRHLPINRGSTLCQLPLYVNITSAIYIHPHICAEELSLVVSYFVPFVRSSIMQQNIPTTLSVRWNKPHAYTYHRINEHSSWIHKPLWSPRLLSSGNSATTLHRTSNPSFHASVSNTVISVGHNVSIETHITTTRNPYLPMRYTTWFDPLTFPPSTTILPIRFRRNDNNTINTPA